MVEELLRRMDLVNMLPASAGVWLKKSREADVLEDVLPVQRENQVTHGLVCCPRDRKSTRLNSSHANISTLSLHDALPISQPHAVTSCTDRQSGCNGGRTPPANGPCKHASSLRRSVA